ncbi:MAG: TonB-dependent receptor [Candidatus Eisenbacteria bacterium]
MAAVERMWSVAARRACLLCVAASVPAAAFASPPGTGASSAAASPRPAPTAQSVSVDTIQVVATRPFPEDRLVLSRGSAQSIPLGDRAGEARDLGDLLDRATGVSVRRLGGLGALTLASIRGSSPSQVVVTIDGVPLATAPEAAVNLALLPASLFERAEIARGPASDASGAAAAGTIHLFSPDRLDPPPRIRLMAGSFGTFALSGLGGIGRGPVSLLASAGTTKSDGDYPYRNRSGTPWQPGDDVTERRANNRFRQDDLLLRGRVSIGPSARVDYMGQRLFKDAGIPGTEQLQTLHIHDRFERWIHSLRLAFEDGRAAGRAAPAGGAVAASSKPVMPAIAWGARIGVRRQEDSDRYRNPQGEAGLPVADQKTSLRSDRIDLELDLPLATRNGLHARTAFERERWRPEDRLRGTSGPARRRTTASAGLAAERVQEAGRIGSIEARAEGRASRIVNRLAAAATDGSAKGAAGGAVAGSLESRDTYLSGDLAVAWQTSPGVRLRLAHGSFVRPPSFAELFGATGVQVGNPGLTAEHGSSSDLGLVLEGRLPLARDWQARFEATAFRSSTCDAIVWLQNSQRTTRAENLERTETRGLEVVLRALRPVRAPLPLRPSLEWIGTLTWQDARDAGPNPAYHGKRLPHLPALEASIEGRIDAGRFALAPVVDFESSLFRDRYNSPGKRRGALARVDLEATVRVAGGRGSVGVGARNLMDRRTQDLDGFPLPGRSVYVEMTWEMARSARDGGADGRQPARER